MAGAAGAAGSRGGAGAGGGAGGQVCNQLVDLGTLPGDTESLPYGLNEAGQVIGRSDPNIMGPFRGFIWELGQMKAVNGGVPLAMNGSGQTTGTPLNSMLLPTGNAQVWLNGPSAPKSLGVTGFALAINDSGQVALYSNSGSGFIWASGDTAPINLGTINPGDRVTTVAINAKGQIVGQSGNVSNRAFLWEAGTMRSLGTLGGCCSSAHDINAAGQVAGDSDTVSHGTYHAYRWDSGTMTDLTPGTPSSGFAINASGQVAGDLNPGSFSGGHAFLWKDGVVTDLGTLGGASSTVAACCARGHPINDWGQVVGTSVTTSGQSHAFLWDSGTMSDLGTLGGTESGAYSINNAHQIVGASTLASGERHAFIYTPCGP